MAAATDLTFDLTPPRRPGLADVGDAALKDHAESPPIPPEQPYADQLNQWAKQIARLGGIVPVASFTVTFSGSTPSIAQFTAMPTGPSTGTFTVTDNGNGDTSITWPANTFPSPVGAPKAALNGDVAALAPIALTIANGVRVKTRNAASTLTDINFTVDVF